MKKPLPKILASILVLMVFTATVLCCWPVKALAGHSPDIMGKAQSHMPACHHKNKSTPSDDNEKTCCHQQLQAIQETQSSLKSNIPQLFAGSPLAGIPPQTYFQKSLFNLAYLDGPPGPVFETPFYILSHSFRI